MTATVFLNGKLMPADQAQVSVFDRGFLFGDGLYEVLTAYDNKLINATEHYQRLALSCKQLSIPLPLSFDQFCAQSHLLISQNALTRGYAKLYWQITRGADTKRQHHSDPLRATLFATAEPYTLPTTHTLSQGFAAITMQDHRPHIAKFKSISLLANIHALYTAAAQHADEAIWLHEGHAVEGCHSNVFIWQNNTLITPPVSDPLLNGVTREALLHLARNTLGWPTQEKKISTDMLINADEIFLCGSTKILWPITQLDQRPVGTGLAGERWRTLFEAYRATMPCAKTVSHT